MTTSTITDGQIRSMALDYLESVMRDDSRKASLGIADRDFSIRLHDEHVRRLGPRASHIRMLQGHI